MNILESGPTEIVKWPTMYYKFWRIKEKWLIMLWLGEKWSIAHFDLSCSRNRPILKCYDLEIRDWSLITGRLQNGKIAGLKLVAPPPPNFCWKIHRKSILAIICLNFTFSTIFLVNNGHRAIKVGLHVNKVQYCRAGHLCFPIFFPFFMKVTWRGLLSFHGNQIGDIIPILLLKTLYQHSK